MKIGRRMTKVDRCSRVLTELVVEDVLDGGDGCVVDGEVAPVVLEVEEGVYRVRRSSEMMGACTKGPSVVSYGGCERTEALQ
jgi:hypothetical protein